MAQTTINIGGLTQPYGGAPTAVNTTTTQGGVYSEIQSLVLSNAAGGTFRLAFEGVVTPAMASNSTAAQVEAELEAMPAIDDVTVTGSSGNFSVTFGGTQANQNVSQIFGDAAHSTSGTTVRSIETTYNAASEITSISDPDATIAYTRDNLGRATTITNTIAGLTPTVAFSQSFDAANNRTGLNATLGGTADFANTYQYDALQRLTDIVQQSQSGGNAVTAKHLTMAYNVLGQSTTISRYQSAATSNPVATSTSTYDTANRLTGLTHSQGSTTLVGYAYTYDGLSRPTSIDSFVDVVTDYSYDVASQLTGADHASQADEAYGFDANGNRNTTDYSTSGNNQTSESPGFTYTYDDEGNRLTRTSTTTGEIEHYTWDHRNRLVQVRTANEYDETIEVVEYAYDAFQRLVRRTADPDGDGSSTATTQYWAYDDGINALVEYDGSTASDLSHRYLWSNAVDQLFADEQVTSLSSSGNVIWPLGDHLGTLRDLADLNESTGVTAVTNHRQYSSFGKLVAETDTSVDIIFNFTGKQYDELTQLQHNLNRWLDSELGRWLSSDPKGFEAGDVNLNRYVANRTISVVDPTGLEGEWYSRFGSDYMYFLTGGDAPADPVWLNYGSEAGFGVAAVAATAATGAWVAGYGGFVVTGTVTTQVVIPSASGGSVVASATVVSAPGVSTVVVHGTMSAGSTSQLVTQVAVVANRAGSSAVTCSTGQCNAAMASYFQRHMARGVFGGSVVPAGTSGGSPVFNIVYQSSSQWRFLLP